MGLEREHGFGEIRMCSPKKKKSLFSKEKIGSLKNRLNKLSGVLIENFSTGKVSPRDSVFLVRARTY